MKHWLLLLALTVNFLPLYARNEKPTSEYLLVVNSYTADAPWSNALIEPVQQWMLESRLPVYTEHLNMLLIDDSTQLATLKRDLFAKYSLHPPRAIVLLGNPTLLLRDDIRSQWGDVPVILCAESDYMAPDSVYLHKRPAAENERIPLTQLTDAYNMTFLQTRIFLRENVELLHHMLPELEKVILIGDGRHVNQQLDYDMRRLMAQHYPGLEYEFLSADDLSLEELMVRLTRYDTSRTGILFSSWFHKTSIGSNTVLNANSFHVIGSLSVPIFGLKYAVMENSGIIGGAIYDQEEFLSKFHQALNLALTPPDTGGGENSGNLHTFPAYIPDKALPTFNYPSLLLNNFSVSECPRGSIFLERPPTFADRYKYALLLAGLLAVLLYSHQRSRIRSLRKVNEARQKQFETGRELASLFENMPVAYMKADLLRNDAGKLTDFSIRRMNGRFITQFCGNRTPGEAVKGSELFRDDFKSFLPFLQLADDHGKSLSFTQYFSEQDVYLYIFVAPAAQANHIDIYGVDTTELYRTQRKLDETNRKLGMVLDVANITPWHWDLRKQTILCELNRSFGQSEGTTRLEEKKTAVPETLYFSKIYKADRPRIQQAWQALVEGKVAKIHEEYRILTRDASGHRLDWVEVQAAVETCNEQGKPLSLVGSSHIITERKRIEAELIRTKEKAEESNRLKSAFLANMSHEIRTPLNAIVGFSELLKETETGDEKEEYVRIIENNNQLLLQLIGDILDLSKIEAGTFEFHEAPVDINQLTQELILSLQLRAKEKGLTIVFGEHLPHCCIQSDKNRLSQVLTNFLTNALKFTSEGQITVGYGPCGDGMLRFYVADTGCGIPADKQSSVFERFTKLNDFVQGTGLGLPICQTIIQRMGGQIGVESEPGKGSTFWFTIPYRSASVLPEKQTVEHELRAVSKNAITILIAEDNGSNFKYFETILRKEYRLLHAWNGQEAVELYKIHQPHLVLMDISMPVMDGYEATTEIRKLSADVPILAITAYAYASDEERILSFGFDGYLSKPTNPHALRKAVIDTLKTRLLML